MKPLQEFFQKPWLYLIIVLIGFSLKFYKIEYKYFWRDEISTIEHTSGNQILDIPVNEIKNITYYTDQLRLKNMDLTIGSELKGLFSSTNLNPMHYPFLMVWYRIAGDEPMSYRYFNIFIIILLLPVLFLLAKSLFKSSLAGWIAISLFVFSPYFHSYTQRARYIIFGVFLIILLHYVFLQAVRQKKIKWWIGYSIVAILSVYTSFLSGLMIMGHFLYVLFFNKEIRVIYGINLFVIILCYLPWIFSLINAQEEIGGSLAWHNYFGSTGNPIKILLCQTVGFNKLFNNSTSLGSTADLVINYNLTREFGYWVLNVALLSIIITSIVYTVKKVPGKISWFLIFIMLPFILFFLVSDLARQTLASIFWRYHGINYVGILLFVVYFLQRKISNGKLYAAGIYAGLIVISFVSILDINEIRGGEKVRTAELISEAKKPLIIADYPFGIGIGLRSFTALLNECSSDKIDILRASADFENVEELLINKDYSEIYVIQSSDELVQNLKEQFGERMDSLEIEGIEPAWQIDLNKEKIHTTIH